VAHPDQRIGDNPGTKGLRAWTIWVLVAVFTVSGFLIWALTNLGGGPGLMVNGVIAPGLSGATIVVTNVLGTLVLATIGVAIASRLPKNRIGWILLGLGLWNGLTFLLIALLMNLAAGDPNKANLANFSNWLGSWTFVPAITFPITFVLMLVPDGRVASPRWRLLPWLAGIGTAGWITDQATSQYLGLDPGSLPNPYGNPMVQAVAKVVGLVLVPAFVGSVASMVMRFRRDEQMVRQQIKLVAFAGVIAVTVTLAGWILSIVRPIAFDSTVIAIAGVAGLILPAAIGVAIFKYRLYDIDRLISRTVTYGAVVGVLAAVYASLAIGLPQILGVPGDAPLLVAAATLASFAVIRPVSRWARLAVDRRFHRARYDAQLEVGSFSARLAHRHDLEQVITETTSLLDRTVQPMELGVWIRDPLASGP
jgi:hypothetical protein